MKIEEIQATNVLVKSKLPDADYVVNPYTGCQFACVYCYASFMGRFVNEPISNWGNYVYVKANAREVFDKELRRLSEAQRNSSILLSSVTDPYQGLEQKYRLTRGILEILVRERYPGLVGILTKSPLVMRDLDLFKNLPRVEVGMTITTTDDTISRFLEVQAPLASRRISTLKQLHAEGVETYAFVGPLLPHFRYQPALLDALFASLADAGVGSVFVEHMNLRGYIRERLWHALEHEPEEIQGVYRCASTAEHREALDRIIADLLRKYDLRLRLGEVLYHNKSKGTTGEQAPSDDHIPTNPE